MPRRKQRAPKQCLLSPEEERRIRLANNAERASSEPDPPCDPQDEPLDLSVKAKKAPSHPSPCEPLTSDRDSNPPTPPALLDSPLNCSLKPSNLPPRPTPSPAHSSPPLSQPVPKAGPQPTLKTPEPPTLKATKSGQQSSSNTLSHLESLVQKVAKEPPKGMPPDMLSAFRFPTPGASGAIGLADGKAFQDLWMRFVKQERSSEQKKASEAKQIFTCLQCQQAFNSMDGLVKHMQITKHFAEIPKHYSWSMQHSRQRMRQIRVKMKYSDRMMYYCHLCQSVFAEAVQDHFSTAHKMTDPVQCMIYVQIVPASTTGPLPVNGGGGDSPKSSPPLSVGSASPVHSPKEPTLKRERPPSRPDPSPSRFVGPDPVKATTSTKRFCFGAGFLNPQSLLLYETPKFPTDLLKEMKNLVKPSNGEPNGVRLKSTVPHAVLSPEKS